MKKYILVIACYFLLGNVFALDQAIKEETTPPAAETALTLTDIPPVLTVVKPAV